MNATATKNGVSRAVIYRKAAKMIESESHDYACEAIGDAAKLSWVCLDGGNPEWPEICLMEPSEVAHDGGWWHYQTERDARVVALCLAAAIAERP